MFPDSESQRRPHRPWFLVKTQRRIQVLTPGKNKLLKKEQKEYLKGEVGHAKRGTDTEMMRCRGFQDRAFT